MAERARVVWMWLDPEGRPIPGASVQVRNAANSAVTVQTLYEDDDPDPTVLTNPFTSGTDGIAEFYMPNTERVILRFSKTGHTTQDIPVDATKSGLNSHVLDGGDHTVSGLTAGHVLTATGATTFAFAAPDVTQVELDAHINDASAAHAASAISNSPAGSISSTTVQAAINELDADITAHIAEGGTGDLVDYQFVRKTTSEEVVSSTTLQNDNDLLFAMGSSETWLIDVVLFVNGHVDGDIRVGWSVPTGASMRSGAVAANSDGVLSAAYVYSLAGTGEYRHYGTVGTGDDINISVIPFKVIVINGGTAGNFQVQWAQYASHPTATKVWNNSYLEARRVG